jgi:hypothetical protein
MAFASSITAYGQQSVPSQIAALQQQVSALSSSVTALQQQLANEIAARQSLSAQVVQIGSSLNSAQQQLGSLQLLYNTLQGQLAAEISTRLSLASLVVPTAAEVITYLRPLEPYLTVDSSTINGLPGPHIIFTGANVHIRSGLGPVTNVNDLFLNPGVYLNGLGNLIVGYDEPNPFAFGPTPAQRNGSHNLVIGVGHQFTSHGGFVAGFANNVMGVGSSVTGGNGNSATGRFSAVLGGGGPVNSPLSGNIASGNASTVSGGVGNTAAGGVSSVAGGGGISVSSDGGWAAGGGPFGTFRFP